MNTADMDAMIFAIKWVLEYKKKMKDKGLRKAQCRCPRKRCNGRVFVSLNGPKDHAHFACTDVTCSIRGME